MCTGAEGLMMMQGASAAGGLVSGVMGGTAQARALENQAAGERDTGVAQAERILRATRKERGAARAAIAASGTALDEFSLINEADIQADGELDASMAILSGERRGRTLEAQASNARREGFNQGAESLLYNGYGAYSGWKGMKGQLSSGVGDTFKWGRE